MTNPFGQIKRQIEEENNPFGSIVRKKEEKKPIPFTSALSTLGIAENMDDFDRIANRVKNIGKILETGYKVMSGTPLNANQVALLNTLDKSVEVTDAAERKAMSDIGHMFSSTENIKDSIKSLFESTKQSLDGATLSSLAKMPVNMIASIAGDAFGASTGLDLNGKDVKTLDVDEANAKIKATVGNMVATAAAPAIEGIMAKAMAPAAMNMATAPIGEVAAMSAKAPRIGRIGEAIIKDATAAAGAGVAQAGIANANQANTIAAMATGLMFAPIGVLTGWYRGVKGAPTATENAITQAHDVLQLRQMQEIGNASVESLKERVSKLITADQIEDVLNPRGLKLYHGTPIKSGFDLPTKFGGRGGESISYTTSPDIANAYAGPEGRILTGFLKSGSKIADASGTVGNLHKISKSEWDEIYKLAKERKVYLGAEATANDPLTWESFMRGGNVGERLQLLKELKYDAVHYSVSREGIFYDLVERNLPNPSKLKAEGTEILVLNPEQVFKVGDMVEDLFPKFEKENLTEGKSFHEAVIDFANKNKMLDNVSELTEKFADTYMKKYAPTDHAELQAIISAVDNQRKMAGGYAADDILDVANRQGFYVTNEHGKLRIRDIESGESVGTAQTTLEAIDLMNRMGKSPNPVLHDLGADLPTPTVNGMPSPITQPHMQTWEPEKMDHAMAIGGANANKFFHNLDLKWNQVTGMNAFIEAIDDRNWALPNEAPIQTNLKKIFNEVERSHRITSDQIKRELNSPKMRVLDEFVRSKANKLSTAELEFVGKALEAQSWEEMVAPNGYAKNFTISQEAQDLARFAHENGVDLNKVLQYRRAQSAIKYEAMRRAETTAKEQFDQNLLTGMDKDDAWQLFREASEKWEENPDIQAGMARIEQIYKPDDKFLAANKALDKIYQSPNATAHTSAAVRLKLALEDPKHYGLSEADFIKEHKFTPAQIKTLNMVKELYEDYRVKFGISDTRKLMRYMNHYRQFGDLLDDAIVSDFERGITDPTMREFASAMIRTGEISNYGMNPITNLQAYVRAGVKSQNIYKTLNEQFSNLEAPLRKELAKIPNKTVKDLVTKRLTDYQRDVTGQISMGNKEVQSIQAHYLKTIAKDENGHALTNAQIIAEMQKPSNIDTLLALQASGLLGGRVSLAMRDNLDMWTKFYTKHGGKRLWKMLNTKVPERRVQELIREGYIVDPEGVDVYNVVHNSTTGKVGKVAKDIANIGYKASLQHHYYLKNQAAVWEHTFENTLDVLKKMDKGIIKDKKTAYKQLFLNGYDEQTQRMFNAHVNAGNYGAAARQLATEETREMVGYFTRGNQAPILNSQGGKVFGQMGSWAMTNRSVLQNLMSRGTKEELAQRYLRFAAANVAIAGAGAATGFNLGRWMLLPTSLITSGGPLLNSIEALTSGTSAAIGGDPRQTNFTNRAISRSLQQFIPFEAAAKDLYKAYDLQAHGMGYGPGRTAGQAIGLPVVKNQQNALDIMLGNYPISWNK